MKFFSQLFQGKVLRSASESQVSQLELPITRVPEPDRNFDKGGRSFYFFDFDDNVAFLSTYIFLFHKKTGREIPVTTAEFAQWGRFVGQRGPYAEYEIRTCDETGSFRRFRDRSMGKMEIFLRKKQPFIEDLAEALGFPEFQWKGPSWSTFYHASFNQRPVSVITARGHHPKTIEDGIGFLVQRGHLPRAPNFLAIYPVSHKPTRHTLGDEEGNWSVANLKKAAIRKSVEKAFEVYGYNPHHRFGMSDDDPHNIELITDEMIRLKADYPEVSFFIIETNGSRYVKKEIFKDHVRSQNLKGPSQIPLFDQE